MRMPTSANKNTLEDRKEPRGKSRHSEYKGRSGSAGRVLLVERFFEQIGEGGFILRIFFGLLELLDMAAHLAETVLDFPIQFLQPGAELVRKRRSVHCMRISSKG